MSTPWLRDDNRYTWADVANMSRGEFDRRRELHVIYGAETPHVAEDFSRRLLGSTPLHNHVRTMYDDASWRARAHDRVYDDLLAMWSYDEESVMPRYKLRLLQLLNPKHYRQARDPLMGDETPYEGITAWREQLRGAPAIEDAAFVPVVDDAYREFHRRQVHELEALGERRVEEARARRSATDRQLVLRGAAARLGRSDGTIVRPESGSVERPESDESSSSESDAELFEDGPVAKRRRLLQSDTPQSGAGNTYRLVDPTTGTTTQHGGSLSESAASVIQYMVMRYGLPALRAHLERLRNSDIQLNGTTDGGARREYMLMDAMAKQLGMGMGNRTVSSEHVGATAAQFLTAGSGQSAVPPGYHRMSDGRLMSSTQHGMGTPSEGDTQSWAATTAGIVLAGLLTSVAGAPSLPDSAGVELQADWTVPGNATVMSGFNPVLSNVSPQHVGAPFVPMDDSWTRPLEWLTAGDSWVAASEPTPDAETAPAPAPVPRILDDEPAPAPAPVPRILDDDETPSPAPATVQPGRVTYSGLGSATLVEPEAAPVRSEAVQIDLSSATVSRPAQDVAHAAHDNLIRLDDNTLVDVGMTQETLDTLTAEVIREFASGPRIEVDPAQETATFAQLLQAALGPKTMAAIVYFANRIGWSSVNAGRRRWAPYARKSGIAGMVFRLVLGAADRASGIKGVTESIVRDTVVGAVIMSLAYLAVMSQLGDMAREVYQTILYMVNAHGDEAADEFADQMRFVKTMLTNTTAAEKATAAAQVSHVQWVTGVMGDFALAGVMAYAGVDMGNLNWATRKVADRVTGFAVGKAAQYSMEGRASDTDIAALDSGALHLMRLGEYLGGTGAVGEQMSTEYASLAPTMASTGVVAEGPGLMANLGGGTFGVFSALAEMGSDQLRAYNGITPPNRTGLLNVAMINHYNALPASERIVYSLGAIIEDPAAQIAMRLLLKVSQHMPHLSENEQLMLANGQLRRYSQEAIDAAGPKAVGDGGPKAIGLPKATPQQVGAFQFIINSGPTARVKAAMHANRAAMHELWESQAGAELWVIGKTIEAIFNTVAAVTVTE